MNDKQLEKLIYKTQKVVIRRSRGGKCGTCIHGKFKDYGRGKFIGWICRKGESIQQYALGIKRCKNWDDRDRVEIRIANKSW